MNSYLKEEVKELLKKALNEFDKGEYIKALITYSQVLAINEKNHEAYFGMYQSWFTYCSIIKQDSPMINELFRNAYRYAPSKIKDKYLKIWEHDKKVFKEIENGK